MFSYIKRWLNRKPSKPANLHFIRIVADPSLTSFTATYSGYHCLTVQVGSTLPKGSKVEVRVGNRIHGWMWMSRPGALNFTPPLNLGDKISVSMDDVPVPFQVFGHVEMKWIMSHREVTPSGNLRLANYYSLAVF